MKEVKSTDLIDYGPFAKDSDLIIHTSGPHPTERGQAFKNKNLQRFNLRVAGFKVNRIESPKNNYSEGMKFIVDQLGNHHKIRNTIQI